MTDYIRDESGIEPGLTKGYKIVEFRVPEIDEEYVGPYGNTILTADENKVAVRSREPRFILRPVPTLSDGSERVVFSVVQEPTIQIAFSDKPLLELTPAEATQLLRQLDAVLL